MPFALCLALGAVVAPPDAVAATAVARRIGLPRRIVTILEGESLLNDATALVLFRVATAAAVGGAVGVLEIAGEVVVAAGGGILIGVVGALVFGFLHKRITDPLLDNALSLLTPFAVVHRRPRRSHASGVVAVVVTGLWTSATGCPLLMSAASRLQMDAFWRLVQFLLEGLVFLLVGPAAAGHRAATLDNRSAPWSGSPRRCSAPSCSTRFLWMFPATYLARLDPADPPPRPAAAARRCRPSSPGPACAAW